MLCQNYGSYKHYFVKCKIILVRIIRNSALSRGTKNYTATETKSDKKSYSAQKQQNTTKHLLQWELFTQTLLITSVMQSDVRHVHTIICFKNQKGFFQGGNMYPTCILSKNKKISAHLVLPVQNANLNDKKDQPNSAQT